MLAVGDVTAAEPIGESGPALVEIGVAWILGDIEGFGPLALDLALTVGEPLLVGRELE